MTTERASPAPRPQSPPAGRRPACGQALVLPSTKRRDSRQVAQMKPALTWHRDGADWILLAGRRRFGRVIPDSQYPGMWRSRLSGGQLSDMANLAWAKNAVLVAAELELEWEERQRAANHPSKCPENRGVFEDAASPAAQIPLRHGDPQ